MIFSHDETLFSVRDLYCDNNGGELFLRWNWRNDVDEAMIFLLGADDVISDRLVASLSPVRRVTRREFGYGLRLTLDRCERVRLVVFPCFIDGGELVLALQDNGLNELSVVPRRHVVEYSVKESSKLFSGEKTVKLSVRCDCAVPASLLCYSLKNSGASYPIPFELRPGDNMIDSIPPISKKDSVTLGLSDPARDAELYELRRML